MWTNGSRSARSTWENARRTGNPSPSRPVRAIVRLLTGRSRATVGSGSGIRGRTVMSSTVIAGMCVVPTGGFARQIVAQSTIYVKEAPRTRGLGRHDDPRPCPGLRVVQPDPRAQVHVVADDIDR